MGDPGACARCWSTWSATPIKFTEHGEVVVRVEAQSARRTIRCRSTSASLDTGIGIAAESSEIFKAFTQADGSTTRRFGGTGLGLAISAQLVSLMGGRMWVDSEVARGSSFHVSDHAAAQHPPTGGAGAGER